MKKFLIIPLIFLLTSCETERISEIPYVKTEIVKKETIFAKKSYQGFIDRKYDVDLSFGLSGIMEKTFVKEGDTVKKGALLAQLNNKEYKLSIEQAKEDLDEAYVKYNRAKSYFERISKLHTAGGISYNDWEAAETDLKSSKNRINILKDALEIAKNKETFSNIYAPYDGQIIKVYKDDGQFVSQGEKVMYFQGKGGLEARFFVSQNDISKIKIGDEITLIADINPNKTYKGKIKSRVNSSINEGSYRTTAEFSEDYPELLDGMSISIFTKENLKAGIYIPLNALPVQGEKQFVYVVEKLNEKEGIAHKKEVKAGEILNDKIQILKGLCAGELIVVEGAGKIMDGSKVKILW